MTRAVVAAPERGGLERVLRRDRAIIVAGVAVVAAAAWLYLAGLAREMGRMDAEMVMPMAQAWSPADLALLWVMWSVMMVAMMLPSAAPMILLFSSVQRQRVEQARPYAPTGVFVVGYLCVWAVYSAAAALLQWRLHEAALLSPAMAGAGGALGGALLLAAGIYQLTPLKASCLGACRSPISFLSTEWREGLNGAFVMGLRHGTICVGCCWAVMTLLFVAGVMNLLWVAALAAFVMAEKVLPSAPWLPRAAGAAMLAAAALLLTTV